MTIKQPAAVQRMEKQSGVKRRRTGYLDACILQTRWLRFCHVRSAISFWVNVIANKEHKALMSIAPARRRNPAKDSISAQWNGKHWLYRINGQQGTLDHWTDNINNSIVNTLSDSTCDNILHTLLHRHRHRHRHLFLTSLLAGQDSETVRQLARHHFYKDCTQRGSRGLRANTEIATLSIHIVWCVTWHHTADSGQGLTLQRSLLCTLLRDLQRYIRSCIF